MPSRTHKTVLGLMAAKTNYGTAAAQTPGQQFCLNAAVIIIVNMIKKKETSSISFSHIVSAMFFATIIMIARYLLMLICQLSVYVRLMGAMCHGEEIVF